MQNKQNIVKDYERGKMRALYILARGDKTEGEIRQKLKNNQYEEEVISKIVEFLNEYGYLNDENYARAFVSEKIKYKSIMQIRSALMLKGLSVSLIDEMIKECSLDQTETIKSLLYKKYRNSIENGETIDKKAFGYLARKGFKSGEIITAIKEVQGDIK